MTLNALLNPDAPPTSLAELAAEYLKLDRARTITVRRPDYPPARILRSQCEGIEPLFMPAYVRRIAPGTSEPK